MGLHLSGVCLLDCLDVALRVDERAGGKDAVGEEGKSARRGEREAREQQGAPRCHADKEHLTIGGRCGVVRATSQAMVAGMSLMSSRETMCRR